MSPDQGERATARKAWWPELRRLYLKNCNRSLNAYARQLGRAHKSVREALIAMALYTPRMTPEQLERRKAARAATGRNGGRGYKLSANDVRAIKALLGIVSADELASRFGVRAQAVRAIETGMAWKRIKL